MQDHTPVDMNKLKLFHLNKKSGLNELMQFKKDHLLSLCTPSVSNTYSICVEYMRNWFIRKFQPGYFKSEFISGKNILADFLKKDMLDFVKRNKPALLIAPKMDFDFTRDNVDLYVYGNQRYCNRARYKDAFFKDPITQNLLSIEMEQIRVEFRFAVKVSEYNHAVDLFKFIQMACRNGATETRYVNLDFQVPKSIMLAIANDSGFAIKDNNIVDTCAFLRYLNQHSRIPFSYKFRGTKGEYEFFIRMTDMYTHLKSEGIEFNDGDRIGQIDANFVVGINVECLFPAPKFYAYYSKKQHSFTNSEGRPVFKFENMCFDAVPTSNDKGWNQYMSTDYVEDEILKRDAKTSIMFEPLLKSQTSNSLFQIAEYTKSIFISPAAFMDIKLFNSGIEQPIDIDWNCYKITSKNHLKERISTIVFYIDLEYINNYTLTHDKAYSTRIVDPKKNDE